MPELQRNNFFPKFLAEAIYTGPIIDAPLSMLLRGSLNALREVADIFLTVMLWLGHNYSPVHSLIFIRPNGLKERGSTDEVRPWALSWKAFSQAPR